MPYEDDPWDESVEAQWQVRQRAQEDTERAELEVWEWDQRSEPKHMTAKVGSNNNRVRRRGRAGTLSAKEWRGIIRAFRSCCAYCGLHVRLPVLEHVVPVAQGGETTCWNVAPACRDCNTAKRGRDPVEWLRSDPKALDGFLRRVVAAWEAANDGGLPQAS